MADLAKGTLPRRTRRQKMGSSEKPENRKECEMSGNEMPMSEMIGDSAAESMPTHGMGGSKMPSARMGEAATGGEMPSGGMGQEATGGEAATGGEMPSGGMGLPLATGAVGERVLVELRVAGGERSLALARASNLPGLTIDPSYEPVPMKPATDEGRGLASGEDTVVVRATIDPTQRAELEANPNVVQIFPDSKIAPFADLAEDLAEFGLDNPSRGENPSLGLVEGMAACPIGTCDCDPGTPKGTIADVANYLGVNQIWAAGQKGESMVVGVVDGGTRAVGRPIKPGESGPKLARVIGGWPTASWGTTAAAWGDHGMMCGTDVLGMAPKAQLYDLRISDGDALSDALQAFQWAINQHMVDGTPHVLTNSWGMYQKAWDPDYTTNPNHPFTRKVVEAIDEGILVLFAAGNCGATCPSGKCSGDTGPGKSIWGANGHPRVMTVGAVNKNEQFVGYSSQGPAALDPNKPDFCSITHFTGYFTSDNGTSAATPIAAGVVALLKQAKPALIQEQVRSALKSTAKDIGPAGFDQHSGAGIIRAKAAYDLVAIPSAWKGWESLGGFCTDGIGVSSWGGGRLDCFVVGNDRHLYHKLFNGGWSGWQDLGGNIYSNPAAVSWGSNRIDVFAIGGDHAMWHRWYS